MLSEIKVSIITAAYNCDSTIEDTYASLCAQTHFNWEWLITDDCSSDNTLAILENIEKSDSRVKVFKNVSNLGAAVTRNVSLKNASGQFLAFIDSDDLWLPNKLELQLDFMGDSIDFSFTAYKIVDSLGNDTGKVVDCGRGQSVDYEDLLRKKATIGCSTVMLRKQAYPNLSMPLIRTGQDYATWLQLLKPGCKAFLLPELLTKYRIMPNSISRNKFKKAKRQWEIYRVHEKLSIVKSIKCFVFYAVRALLR